jgi:hypothetical protein
MQYTVLPEVVIVLDMCYAAVPPAPRYPGEARIYNFTVLYRCCAHALYDTVPY